MSPSLRARAALGASSLAWRHRELDRARDLALEARELFRELDDRAHVAWALGNLGIIAELAGDFDESEARAAEAEQIFRDLGHKHGALTQTHNQSSDRN